MLKIAQEDRKPGWHRGYELRLVPGMHACDKELTRQILIILQKEFRLTGSQILETYQKSPKEDQYRHPEKKVHVLTTFPEGGVREDLGEIALAEFRRREAVFFVTHPYCHQEGTDVDTTASSMRMFARILQAKNMEVKQISLVVPVNPFDLNHSVRRHARKGFVEGYRLKMHLEDLARDGYSEIITIASHSPTTKEEANALGMNLREIDPFRGEWGVPSTKMGPFLYMNSGNIIKKGHYQKQMARLMPFVDYIRKNYRRGLRSLCFVATDDGSEQTIEELAYACRGDKQNILAILKERSGPEKNRIVGVKSSSTMELDQIRGRTCIIADDRRLSGGTLNDVAKELKRYGAGHVVALVAHDISYNTGIKDHKYVDRFVFLETNPQSAIAGIRSRRIERLPMETTALLLASEIFDSYVNMRDRGEVKVR